MTSDSHANTVNFPTRLPTLTRWRRKPLRYNAHYFTINLFREVTHAITEHEPKTYCLRSKPFGGVYGARKTISELWMREKWDESKPEMQDGGGGGEAREVGNVSFPPSPALLHLCFALFPLLANPRSPRKRSLHSPEDKWRGSVYRPFQKVSSLLVVLPH